jgi:surface protein
VEYCCGDEYVTKYVHSTSSLSCPLCFFLLSLEICPLVHTHHHCCFPILFFLDCCVHTTTAPTAFSGASAFNANLSNWNTAAVTTMESSTSTPSSFFCCPLLLSFEFSSLTSVAFSSFFFPSFYRQWLPTNVVRRCLVVFDR